MLLFESLLLLENLKIVCWLMSTHSLLFCSHNKRDSFSGNVVQNMHVNDDHSIAPSFTTTLVVSKSKWQNWYRGPYALLSASAIIPINQHLPLCAQNIPTDNYLHCKPFVLQTCNKQRNIHSWIVLCQWWFIYLFLFVCFLSFYDFIPCFTICE